MSCGDAEFLTTVNFLVPLGPEWNLGVIDIGSAESTHPARQTMQLYLR